MKFTIDFSRNIAKANTVEIHGNYQVFYDEMGYVKSCVKFQPGVVVGPEDPKFDKNGFERFGDVTTEKE